MKPNVPAFLPAIAILAAGLLFLRYQHTEILELENKPPAATSPRTVANAAKLPLPDERRPAIKPASTPKLAGDARAAAFLKGFREKAQPLVEKAERDAAGERARHKAGRAALLLALSAPQTDSLRTHLEKQELPDIDAAARDWIAQHRGEEDAAKYDGAELASRTAAVEHEAQDAIYRLSRIVDLTPEQKDRLYAGFVRKAAGAPDKKSEPYELRIAFSLQDTPSLKEPASLARPLLTPEQGSFFDAAQEQEKKAVKESTQEVMGQLMPALLGSLQEAAAAGSTVPSP